ncbi:CAP domain-containing protein [Strongyloides ratti]|uniref:CAP domain-containing protein n=1 Tax=Strongyloides ratti TaxID=34506 RepID=A0A090KXB9_STRRB|nr:CAP domain-containing protein [Strongyloides ratti]CEF60527.1 CAP domain-containing protein [Strongyloides ratti]
MHIGYGSQFYSYHDQFFSTKKQMIDHILEDHKNMQFDSLYIQYINSIYNGEIFFEKNMPRYERIIGKRKEMYQCNGKNFNSFLQAIDGCSKNINSISKLTTKPVIINTNKNDINHINDGINFSKKIWYKIWNGCGYQCYSKNNFQIMKFNFLKEINEYRYAHGCGRLMENLKLSMHIQMIAEKIARMYRKGEKINLNNSAIVNLMNAPLLIKTWYDENKYYNYESNYLNQKAIHFTSLIWMRTRYIGFGITKVNEMLVITIMYEPLPNIPNLFTKNIFRRKI